jgi:hypothetical protein
MPAKARAARLVEVSATLEVVVPPSVPALYFWAMQVDFVDGSGVWGGGHTGLQWNQRYPKGTAVNWGGYDSAERGGAVLPGSESTLPGYRDDPNTLAYPWQPGRPYRFRVFRSPDITGAWRSEVTDILLGDVATIRDLLPRQKHGGGEGGEPGFFRRLFSGQRDASPGAGEDGYLTRPIVWSEVFAECDAPSVTVRWSALEAVDEEGTILLPEAVQVNYQSGHEGGCPNTTVSIDESGGVVQVTNVPRTVPQGAVLSIAG